MLSRNPVRVVCVARLIPPTQGFLFTVMVSSRCKDSNDNDKQNTLEWRVKLIFVFHFLLKPCCPSVIGNKKSTLSLGDVHFILARKI